MIIDTHCHLDEFFDSPTSLSQSYLSFEQSAYSPHFLSMSITPDSWDSIIQLSKQNFHIHAALGIHPWYVDDSSLLKIQALNQLVNSEQVLAIGEIGLDFGPKYKVNAEMQLSVLEAQLVLASECGKPVSLHVFKAHNEMLARLQQHNVQGVIHGLGSSVQVAQQYVDLGFKIGVNPVVLKRNARRYHDLVNYLGLEHLVLETDYPNILVPGLSEPQLSDIILVADKVADLLGEPVSSVIETTSRNAIQLFKIHGI